MLKSQLYHLLALPMLIKAQLDQYFEARQSSNDGACTVVCEVENERCSSSEPCSSLLGSALVLGRVSELKPKIIDMAVNTIVVTSSEPMPTETVTSFSPPPTSPSSLLPSGVLSAVTTMAPELSTVTTSFPQSTSSSSAVPFATITVNVDITSIFTSISTFVELTTIVLTPSSTAIQSTGGPSTSTSRSGAGKSGIDENLVLLGLVVVAGMLF